MKNYAIAAMTIITAIMLGSCTFGLTCLQGTGDIKTEARELGYFESVNLMTNADVFISQGDELSIRIEANENLIKSIKTSISDETLIIDSDEPVCPEKLNIYITMKEVKNFRLFGSGSFHNFTALHSDEIYLKSCGSGDINFTDIWTANLGVLSMGSGGINVNGKSHSSFFEINGSGNINAINLNTDFLDVLMNGSGNAKANVSTDLSVKINGSGSLRYMGDPEIRKMEIKGSGELKKLKIIS